jgi:hypothetical protein
MPRLLFSPNGTPKARCDLTKPMREVRIAVIVTRRPPSGALAGLLLVLGAGGGVSASQTRVAVVVDWQNSFRSAQDAFGPGTNGNVYPLALARRLAEDRLPGQGAGELVSLDIHTGIPSQRQDALSYAARRRQISVWQRVHPFVKVHARTLAIRKGNLVEKGVDVAVTLSLLRHLFFDADPCDVAVLVCADTDQLPTLELIVEKRGARSIEVATWDGPHRGPQPLALQGHQIRQHRLSYNLYRSIEDTTPYNQRRP